MMTVAKSKAALRLAARHELWRKASTGEGDLSWKLHAGQKVIYDAIKSTRHKRVYLNISRQFGKSTLLLLIAWELCLKRPGARVTYWGPTGKDADDIATNKAQWLLADCPDDLKPTYRAVEKAFQFGNGSEIVFIGANGDRARYARGRTVDMHVMDEAAEFDDLADVVNAVAMPSTLHTGGRIFLASTPARSPGHYSTILARKCASEGQGAYFHFTIHDNPLINAETVAEYCKEAGGADSSTWKREYLADLTAIDTNTALVPELTDKLRSEIFLDHGRPDYFPWCDRYVAVDPGMDDKTGVIFAWFDPIAQKLIAEDCLLLDRANTRVIAEEIKKKEETLWPGMKPYMRIIDDSGKRVVADMWDQHQLTFSPARKDDREAAVNLLRLYVGGRQFLIHPRAETLANQLQFATVKPGTTELERTAAQGHFDLAAAAWYLVRTANDNKHRRPIPPHYNLGPNQAVFPRTSKPINPLRNALLSRTSLGRRLLK